MVALKSIWLVCFRLLAVHLFNERESSVRFFVRWFYSSIDPFWAPVTLLHFFLILFQIRRVFEFKIRSALWAIAGNQIFWQIQGI
jgi:hypothetical protein